MGTRATFVQVQKIYYSIYFLLRSSQVFSPHRSNPSTGFIASLRLLDRWVKIHVRQQIVCWLYCDMDIRHVTITFNIRRFANDLVRVITPEIRYDRVWVSHLFNGERKKAADLHWESFLTRVRRWMMSFDAGEKLLFRWKRKFCIAFPARQPVQSLSQVRYQWGSD